MDPIGVGTVGAGPPTFQWAIVGAPSRKRIRIATEMNGTNVIWPMEDPTNAGNITMEGPLSSSSGAH